MSCIYKGKVIESELSQNSKGGTEMMRERLLRNVNPMLLKDVAIHFSRPRELYDDVPNILYCHDLAEDPENNILFDDGWKKFNHFVFVSSWQRDQYVTRFGIPYSLCSVIYNAVEVEYDPKNKPIDTIKFVYHTTPHRGLELLVPIFEAMCQRYDNIELDVYSSFGVYGWESRDEQYKDVFDKIKQHPKMNYHGAVSNQKVLAALEDAHVFLYPNIWKETSCIALIEAIKSQVICVHPNYGALPETAANATIVYDYDEDPSAHANYAYAVACHLVENMNADPDYFQKFTTSDRYNLARNNIQSYKTLWDSLITTLLENKG